MKHKILYFFLLTLLLSCNSSTVEQKGTAQNGNANNIGEYTISKDSLISRLTEITADTLDCSAETYWKIIKRGEKSIPLLIESLTDTTMTRIYNHCKKGNLNVGEVSYFALNEIAEFPAFVVTHIQFDVFTEDGCWSFYDYLYDNKNKPQYKKMVSTFYQTNKYEFEKFKKSQLTECRKQYGITGKYRWREYRNDWQYSSQKQYDTHKKPNRDSLVVLNNQQFDSILEHCISLLKTLRNTEIQDEDHIKIIRLINTISMSQGNLLKFEICADFMKIVEEKDYIRQVATLYDWTPNKGMGYYFRELQIELGGTPSLYSRYTIK